MKFIKLLLVFLIFITPVYAKETVDFIKGVFHTDEFLPLHPPCFDNKEKEL